MASPLTRRPTRSWARLLAGLAILAATATLSFATELGGGPSAGLAAPAKASPTASHRPSPSPTPTCAFDFDPTCPSPTPSVIVISPVPDDTPSPNGTPAYLIGLSPSPTDTSAVTGGPPVPLGGVVNDLPSPRGSDSGRPDPNQRSGGIPLPFLLIGLLLAAGAAGALIYAVAPPEKQFFSRAKPATSSIEFTPYGPEKR